MIEVDITPEMVSLAQQKDKEMGTLRNSITKGEGNVVGFLGEIIANSVLKGRIENTYEYDIILSNGTTVDVKTKKTTAQPKPSYDCSVAAFNTKQKCTVYCFVRVHSDLKKGWVLGMYDKKDYFTDAIFLQRGDVDPSNNYTVKSDCYNMKIQDLQPLEGFV